MPCDKRLLQCFLCFQMAPLSNFCSNQKNKKHFNRSPCLRLPCLILDWMDKMLTKSVLFFPRDQVIVSCLACQVHLATSGSCYRPRLSALFFPSFLPRPVQLQPPLLLPALVKPLLPGLHTSEHTHLSCTVHTVFSKQTKSHHSP